MFAMAKFTLLDDGADSVSELAQDLHYPSLPLARFGNNVWVPLERFKIYGNHVSTASPA